LNQSDYIAIAALLVSFLSAIYARWSVREAKLANEISLHASKVAIYEEVVSFSDCFRGLLSVPTSDRLQQFKRNAVQRSELYLSNEAHLLLLEIYNFCKDSEIWLDIASGDEKGSGHVPSELEVRQEYKSVLNLLYPAIERIKKESKIESA
jgi:hypothetical protein